MFQALLLAAGTTLVRAASDDETKGGRYAHFNGMFFMVVFVAAVFLVGKITGALGAPSLVGEILVGVLLGPPVLDFVPNPGVLMLVGEVGLVLLVVEAGLHVDVEMLEIIGARGLAVGLLGSALPLALALTAAYFWGATLVEAFAVGACMATMSTGIALNVMKSGNVLNQPIGQLIIAAATVNEIVNITLITTVENIVRGADAAGYAVPLCVMVAMIAVVGYLAVKKIPGWLEALLRRVPEAARPRAVLACVLAVALVLVPACKYSGSSELLGAFLAGFCFCSDHVVHGVWDRQVKRVMQWLLRLFFSATIGFAIPVRTMGTAGTLAKAGLLLCCGVGKIAMGFFAQPLDWDHFGILACAWGEWGEFSFLIAAAARRHHGKGLLRDETYNAICLAVLISMVLAPAGLRFMLARYENIVKFQIAEAIADTADVGGSKHATYFCLQTKSRARWGQELKLAEAVARLGCEVIDHRQWHPNDHFGLAHCVQELYVRDGTLSRPAPLTRSYSKVPDLICAQVTTDGRRPASGRGGGPRASNGGHRRDDPPRPRRRRPERSSAPSLASGLPRRRRRGAPRADRGRGGPVPVPRDERRRASQADGPQRVAAEPSRRGVAAAASDLTTQPVEPATARRGRAPRARSRRGHAGVPDRDAVGGAPRRRAPRIGRFCPPRRAPSLRVTR